MKSEFNDKNYSYLSQFANNQKDIQDSAKELDTINSGDNIDKTNSIKIKKLKKMSPIKIKKSKT